MVIVPECENEVGTEDVQRCGIYLRAEENTAKPQIEDDCANILSPNELGWITHVVL